MGRSSRRVSFSGGVYAVILLITVLVSASFAGPCAAQPQFANRLYKEGDFLLAALEYERLIYFSDSTTMVPTWRYMLGMSYRRAGLHQKAIERFLHIDSLHEVYTVARYRAAQSYLSLHRIDKAQSMLRDSRTDSCILLRGYTRLLQHRYAHARKDFQRIDSGSAHIQKARAMARITDTLVNFTPKRYIYAGLLSVVPGLGHTYTGQWKDGLFSLSVVGTFGGVAYYYYHHDAYTRAATVGTISALFYAGSIYGALTGVKLFNRDRKQQLEQRAQRIYRGL